MSTMGTCRSCGAPVIWAKKADGKATPLDAVSPSDGNIRIDKNGFAVVGKKGTGPYQSHFASCPQAEQWRSGQRPVNRGSRQGD
jgi:hypothetical protein